MKAKFDFITNSSSASFIVRVSHLTCKQRTMLDKLDDTGWKILDEFPVIYGSTSMDNFDMESYLRKNGFPMDKIQFFSSNDEVEDEVYLKSTETCDCKLCKTMREFNENKK